MSPSGINTCVDASNTDLFLRIDVYLFLALGEIDRFLFIPCLLDVNEEYDLLVMEIY